MTLLLSIHDVTPAFQGEVELLDALCRRHGAAPALLVVPDWHGEWPIERHPDFVTWVRQRVAGGAEIILHGERHDEVGSPRRWGDHLRAFGRTAREGEFLTLGYGVALERITRGVTRLRNLGLEPIGFVPPAWLCRPAAHHAVADSGLRFSEDERGLHLHPGGRVIPAPAVRWSSRTAFRAHGSALVAAIRWRLQRNRPVIRLALHPADLRHPATIRSLERALDRWTREHPVTPYSTYIA